MKFIIYNFIIILFIPAICFSQSSGGNKRFMFEVSTLFGWGRSQIAGDAQVPSIGTFDLGVGLGINIKKFTIGVGYDYRILTQYSDVDPTVGNRRGYFATPSILLRVNFEKIKIGIILITDGIYDLTNITANGKKVAYTKPSGYRFELNFKKIKKITPMIYSESFSFSGMQLDGVNSALSSNLVYSNFGAGLKYEF